jgi:hypothetical protein
MPVNKERLFKEAQGLVKKLTAEEIEELLAVLSN